jgi:DNA-binding MarR family transcriptional regulator
MAQRTSLLFDIYVLHRAVAGLLGEALSGGPLRPDEYAVYSYLLETPEATPTAMARELNMAPQTVSDWLRHLTARGHVSKSRRTSDRRSYQIRLTEAGREAHRAAGRQFDRANRRFLKALRRPEVEMRVYMAEAIAAAEAAAIRLRYDLTNRAG